jgi:hypothetical protein
MTWYAAHIVMFVEFKTGEQRRFPVWENIVLIKAQSEEDAFAQAERQGRAEEGDDGGSFRWGKHPARWIFAGVRKLTECEHSNEIPGSGTELSYTELEFDSRESIEKLVAGKPVDARFNDRFHPVAKRNPHTVEQPKPRRRKPA